jgi:hypothetical protein
MQEKGQHRLNLRERLHWLGDCQLLKKDFAALSV